MSEATGTAVAKRKDILSPEMRAHVDAVKARNTMMQEIAAQSWGKGLSPNAQRALAEYLRISETDVTEVDILGGNIYRNSKWYTRRLSEMTERGEIEYARHRMIHIDKRLEKIADYDGDDAEERKQAEWAQKEIRIRQQERIARGVPDDATVACAWWIKHRDMAEEVTDCKFIVKGRKKTIKRKDGGGTFQVDADPVGDEHPETTVVSRAFRRTLRYLGTRLPHLKAVEERIAEEDKNAALHIGEIRVIEAEREAKIAPLDKVAMIPGGENVYEDTEPVVTESVDEPDDAEQDEDSAPVGDSLFGADVGTRPRGRKQVED